jgi:hypothetical protein
VDKRLSKTLERQQKTINKDHQQYYTIDQPSSHSWRTSMIPFRSNGNQLTLHRRVPIHFLNPEQVKSVVEEYTSDTHAEATLYESAIFSNLLPQLAVITIEDPIIGRKTLYAEVFKIVQKYVHVNTWQSAGNNLKITRTKYKVHVGKNKNTLCIY